MTDFFMFDSFRRWVEFAITGPAISSGAFNETGGLHVVADGGCHETPYAPSDRDHGGRLFEL
jgi:hypothetical protein